MGSPVQALQRLAIAAMVVSALGGLYEASKALGWVKPQPYWQERCIAYRTQTIPVRKRLGEEWVLVDHHRPICTQTERVCVVPENARPQTCKGAA